MEFYSYLHPRIYTEEQQFVHNVDNKITSIEPADLNEITQKL